MKKFIVAAAGLSPLAAQVPTLASAQACKLTAIGPRLPVGLGPQDVAQPVECLSGGSV